jgi:hypothetical protein
MKRRLLVFAVLAAILPLSLSKTAEARANRCFEENYGGGTCATTCVWYNDQGSVEGFDTQFHGC